jgi:hypothetical protein
MRPFRQMIEKLVAWFQQARTNEQTHMRADPVDRFSFNARILTGQAHGNPVFAIVHLDSKCKDNWVSADIVSRCGLQYELEHTDKGPFLGFGGAPFYPDGQVRLTWYAEKTMRTRETYFLVCQYPPFDLILGSEFIGKEGLFIFNESALALRAVELLDCRCLILFVLGLC